MNGIGKLAATRPSSTGRGLCVVVNAASGPDSHGEDLAELSTALPDAEIVRVEQPDQLVDAMDSAARRSTALGVLGGDGTVGSAAAAAIGAGIPLAVFPGGTLNHFARDLGIGSIEEAIAAVAGGRVVAIDTGSIDGRLFLNTASFGSYARFVQHREAKEDRLGKWPATVVALLKVLAEGEPFDARIDGRPTKVWMVFIGNGDYEPAGFVPAGRPRLDDGLLDLRVVDGSKRFARARLIGALVSGRLARSDVYTRRLVNWIDVETRLEQTELAADGEVFVGNGSFVVAKDRLALQVFVPESR